MLVERALGAFTMASAHHTIDYVEFTVRDLAAAKGFYSTAFGWQFNDHGAEYAGIKGVDGEVGGMYQATQARTGGPLVILYSNLEKTLAAVRAAGGKIVREPFAFPGGRRFQFTDPSGNELGVWSEAPGGY
jgi:predicted enzyme related to lactoylglutathione lyase